MDLKFTTEEVVNSDDSDEDDDEPLRKRVLRHRNTYCHRKLPHLIGSERFFSDDTLGVVAYAPDAEYESADDESDTSTSPSLTAEEPTLETVSEPGLLTRDFSARESTAGSKRPWSAPEASSRGEPKRVCQPLDAEKMAAVKQALRGFDQETDDLFDLQDEMEVEAAQGRPEGGSLSYTQPESPKPKKAIKHQTSTDDLLEDSPPAVQWPRYYQKSPEPVDRSFGRVHGLFIPPVRVDRLDKEDEVVFGPEDTFGAHRQRRLQAERRARDEEEARREAKASAKAQRKKKEPEIPDTYKPSVLFPSYIPPDSEEEDDDLWKEPMPIGTRSAVDLFPRATFPTDPWLQGLSSSDDVSASLWDEPEPANEPRDSASVASPSTDFLSTASTSDSFKTIKGSSVPSTSRSTISSSTTLTGTSQTTLAESLPSKTSLTGEASFTSAKLSIFDDLDSEDDLFKSCPNITKKSAETKEQVSSESSDEDIFKVPLKMVTTTLNIVGDQKEEAHTTEQPREQQPDWPIFDPERERLSMVASDDELYIDACESRGLHPSLILNVLPRSSSMPQLALDYRKIIPPSVHTLIHNRPPPAISKRWLPKPINVEDLRRNRQQIERTINRRFRRVFNNYDRVSQSERDHYLSMYRYSRTDLPCKTYAMTESGEVDQTVDPVFLKAYIKKKDRIMPVTSAAPRNIPVDQLRRRSDSTMDSYETAGGSRDRMQDFAQVPAVSSLPNVLKTRQTSRAITFSEDEPDRATNEDGTPQLQVLFERKEGMTDLESVSSVSSSGTFSDAKSQQSASSTGKLKPSQLININVQALLPGAKSAVKKSESVPATQDSVEDTRLSISEPLPVDDLFSTPMQHHESPEDLFAIPTPTTQAFQSPMKSSLSFPEMPPPTQTLAHPTKDRARKASSRAPTRRGRTGVSTPAPPPPLPHFLPAPPPPLPRTLLGPQLYIPDLPTPEVSSTDLPAALLSPKVSYPDLPTPEVSDPDLPTRPQQLPGNFVSSPFYDSQPPPLEVEEARSSDIFDNFWDEEDEAPLSQLVSGSLAHEPPPLIVSSSSLFDEFNAAFITPSSAIGSISPVVSDDALTIDSDIYTSQAGSLPNLNPIWSDAKIPSASANKSCPEILIEASTARKPNDPPRSTSQRRPYLSEIIPKNTKSCPEITGGSTAEPTDASLFADNRPTFGMPYSSLEPVIPVPSNTKSCPVIMISSRASPRDLVESTDAPLFPDDPPTESTEQLEEEEDGASSLFSFLPGIFKKKKKGKSSGGAQASLFDEEDEDNNMFTTSTPRSSDNSSTSAASAATASPRPRPGSSKPVPMKGEEVDDDPLSSIPDQDK